MAKKRKRPKAVDKRSRRLLRALPIEIKDNILATYQRAPEPYRFFITDTSLYYVIRFGSKNQVKLARQMLNIKRIMRKCLDKEKLLAYSKRSRKLVLIFMIVLVVLMLALIGLVAYHLWLYRDSDSVTLGPVTISGGPTGATLSSQQGKADVILSGRVLHGLPTTPASS